MPTWEQAERFITTSGLAALLVLAFIAGVACAVRGAWHFGKPLIEKWFNKQTEWFDKQITLVDSIITQLTHFKEGERSQNRAMASLGRAIQAASPDEKAVIVKKHIDEMHTHLNLDRDSDK
jgi:hypothetical protein